MNYNLFLNHYINFLYKYIENLYLEYKRKLIPFNSKYKFLFLLYDIYIKRKKPYDRNDNLNVFQSLPNIYYS